MKKNGLAHGLDTSFKCVNADVCSVEVVLNIKETIFINWLKFTQKILRASNIKNIFMLPQIQTSVMLYLWVILDIVTDITFRHFFIPRPLGKGDFNQARILYGV